MYYCVFSQLRRSQKQSLASTRYSKAILLVAAMLCISGCQSGARFQTIQPAQPTSTQQGASSADPRAGNRPSSAPR